jgi:hypothetical protein
MLLLYTFDDGTPGWCEGSALPAMSSCAGRPARRWQVNPARAAP